MSSDQPQTGSSSDVAVTAEQQPEAAAPSLYDNGSARSPSHLSMKSAAMKRYLQAEKQFKAAKKAWAKPTPVFLSNQERNRVRPANCPEAVYNIKIGTIEGRLKNEVRRPSAVFTSASAQRPPVRPASAPSSSYRIPAPKATTVASVPFRSKTPREVSSGPKVKLVDAQHQLPAPVDTVKAAAQKRLSKGAVGLISKAPRLAPPRTSACTAVYKLQEPKSGVAATVWAKSRVDQRPPVRRPNDPQGSAPPKIMPTDLSVASKSRPGAVSSFHSATPRFPPTKVDTPPVGKYTPRYIAYGMLS